MSTSPLGRKQSGIKQQTPETKFTLLQDKILIFFNRKFHIYHVPHKFQMLFTTSCENKSQINYQKITYHITED